MGRYLKLLSVLLLLIVIGACATVPTDKKRPACRHLISEGRILHDYGEMWEDTTGQIYFFSTYWGRVIEIDDMNKLTLFCKLANLSMGTAADYAPREPIEPHDPTP